MLSAPADLSVDDVRIALAGGWGIRAAGIGYRAVGFGSHHWAVTDTGGARWFVTADRAAGQLEPALRTAIALRAAGLEFVVAPRIAVTGRATQPAGTGYLLSVFPHVEGAAPDVDAHADGDKPAVRAMLARLHATPAPAEPLDLELPLRAELRRAPTTVGDGPYGRRANELFRKHSGLIGELLAEYDRLRATTLPPRDEWVVTHGEPHPRNIMRTPHGLRLVDWDTVRLAPPARDLWHVDDRPAYAFFRLRWRLSDIACYARDLGVPHAGTADTSAAFRYLRESLADS